MNDIQHKNKEHSILARSIFALLGFAWLIGFVTELYQFFYGEHLSILIILTLGILSYIFIHAAYKGKAPSWIEDKSIFGSIKEEHEPK